MLLKNTILKEAERLWSMHSYQWQSALEQHTRLPAAVIKTNVLKSQPFDSSEVILCRLRPDRKGAVVEHFKKKKRKMSH